MILENSFLKKYIQPDEVLPELKKENELNTDDKVYLINKNIDEKNMLDIYEGLINRKKHIINENNTDINDYVFNDIEFLHDHYLNIEKGIFFKLNKCNTKIGELLLKNILLKPIYDIDILNNRQKIIKNIKKVKDSIIPILNEIKIIESDLIWFWDDVNVKHIESMDNLIYFNYDFIPFFNVNEILNNNEKALLITNIYKIIVAPLLTILTPLISLLLPLIVIFYMNRKTVNIPVGVVFKQYINTLFSSDSMKVIFKNPSKAFLASLVTKGIYLFMYFQNIYYSLQSSSNTNKIVNTIHEKLNKMTSYIKLTNKIKKICNDNDLSDLSSFIKYTKINDDISFYDSFFNFPVFNKSPGLISDKGKILYTYKKFKLNKDNVSDVFHYTGTIDLILSIENILSNSSSENPYCLTKFLKNKEPKLNIKKIWHPYLDKNEVPNIVKNSIDIKNNILITGPNAAGKSTFIKSVIINIILSQTLGISSSEKFELTPFNMIETYLHIPDSKGNSSLFEAEMFRSKEYIEKLKNMDNDKFSFIVLDEIFSSTNYVEGFSGAYAILKKISSFSNTLSITTTHYSDLEVLEKDTKGRIKNYKFEVDHDANNDIIFNYILKEGTSRQYIALELLKKNGFDDDLIEDAIKISNKVKQNKILDKPKKKKILKV